MYAGNRLKETNSPEKIDKIIQKISLKVKTLFSQNVNVPIKNIIYLRHGMLKGGFHKQDNRIVSQNIPEAHFKTRIIFQNIRKQIIIKYNGLFFLFIHTCNFRLGISNTCTSLSNRIFNTYLHMSGYFKKFNIKKSDRNYIIKPRQIIFTSVVSNHYTHGLCVSKNKFID